MTVNANLPANGKPDDRTSPESRINLYDTDIFTGISDHPVPPFFQEMVEYAGLLEPEILSIRRDLHAHPELLYDVARTAGKVAELLESWGIQVRRNVGKHFGMGVVGTLQGQAGSGPVILLRADMDALPIEERNELPYKSRNAGVMHACGHDAHTAMLLGAAKTLSAFREHLTGTVIFVFQPAEEGAVQSPLDGRLLSGGRDLIEDGTLENVDYAYALHVMPDLPAGTLGVHPHYAMAASSHFKVEFRGTAGHHSAPHQSVDAIQMAARFITDINGLMANQTDPQEAAVLAFGTLHAGTAVNVIAGQSELTGTFRAFSKSTVARITEGLERYASAVADAFGGQYRIELREGITVVNDSEAVQRMLRAAREALGEDRAILLDQPSLAGEDFGWYLDRVPGAFAFIGCGNVEKGIIHAIHQPQFNIDEDMLVYGVRVWVSLVMQHL
ncbi:M20 family metallopeptidase [Paenibacillus sp. NFR01]|uniref:M20 metallopeptidase family protein n=1 Tax=Paenibacillus sp. NFR01 TaxID=1566279 RepID=UPI0008B31709|nr:amidohydrolase [Paenibacillus sp. NFR01]SET26064.1 amidohydrolase [Paenibacillus sp. NFR01]